MTAADAPELLSRAREIGSTTLDGDTLTNLQYVLGRGFCAMGMPPAFANRMLNKLAECEATDLAAKLAAAERTKEQALADLHGMQDGSLLRDERARADRAEAKLAAAQEAMRERCARYVETRDWWVNRTMRDRMAFGVRALPIPAAKPEGE